MNRKLFLAAFALLARPAHACEIPTGWQEMESENGSNLAVAALLPTQPIQTGAQFHIDVMVCGEALEPHQVELDAIMPAHRHGMNYFPTVTKSEGDLFRAEGMFFHMPGQWQIQVDLKGQKTQRFYLDVAAK